MPYRTRIAAAIIALFSAGVATAAPPKVVAGPNSDPQCFAPWASNTKLFQYPAKKGPYRIALANGYIANTWRIQMIQTAKAFAAQPDVAAKLKEFKVVAQKQPGSNGGYTVDHTAGSYIFDPSGRVRLFAAYGGGAPPLLHDIRVLLKTAS